MRTENFLFNSFVIKTQNKFVPGRRIRPLHQGREQGHPDQSHLHPSEPEDQAPGSLQTRPPTNENKLTLFLPKNNFNN